MGLFSSIGKALSGVVKGAGGLIKRAGSSAMKAVGGLARAAGKVGQVASVIPGLGAIGTVATAVGNLIGTGERFVDANGGILGAAEEINRAAEVQEQSAAALGWLKRNVALVAAACGLLLFSTRAGRRMLGVR